MNTQDLRSSNRAATGGALNGAVVARPEDGVWFDVVPGESATVRIPSDMVGGRYTIMEHDIAPEAGPPLHSHVEEEVFVVLEGVITFVNGDDRFEGSAGTIVVIPAGTAHTWANLSGKPARMRTMFTPGGIEKLFSNLAGLSPDAFVALAETFGSKILGPGISA
ncbi:cupin domain-containing protein [Tabrizicola sp.]|uniref:cupin domain-containing protein n=1 Tax=Tabrizicola sp. TaxID=2005166 RepID=UPI003F326C2F